MGMRGQGLENFYQHQVPSRVILAAELITKDNAADYYEPDSLY
jgi:ribose transport system substrate-binding protein